MRSCGTFCNDRVRAASVVNEYQSDVVRGDLLPGQVTGVSGMTQAPRSAQEYVECESDGESAPR